MVGGTGIGDWGLGIGDWGLGIRAEYPQIGTSRKATLRWIDRVLVVSVAAVLSTTAVRAQAPALPAPDVSKLAISSPATMRELETKEVRGIPTRLAWSPDGEWFYVRVSAFDRWSNETVRHVLIETQGTRVQPLTDEPGWLARYWNLKSALTSPVVSTWRIKIDAREEQVRTINVPREGNIGQQGVVRLDQLLQVLTFLQTLVQHEFPEWNYCSHRL
jgi:hypothetical protein